MNRYGSMFSMNVTNFRRQRGALLILVALLTVACVLFAIGTFRGNAGDARMQEQIRQRMLSNANSAVSGAERLSASITSNAALQLSYIRQYVYAMQQLNQVSVSLYGERGRYVEEEVFTIISQQLDEYDKLAQVATTSTVSIRSKLVTNITNLQYVLSQHIE